MDKAGWSRDLPRIPGYYWVRLLGYERAPTVAEIEMHDGVLSHSQTTAVRYADRDGIEREAADCLVRANPVVVVCDRQPRGMSELSMR